MKKSFAMKKVLEPGKPAKEYGLLRREWEDHHICKYLVPGCKGDMCEEIRPFANIWCQGVKQKSTGGLASLQILGARVVFPKRERKVPFKSRFLKIV